MRLNKYVYLFEYKGQYWGYNQLSGNLINMIQSVYNALRTGEVDKIDETTKSFLVSTQFLVDDDFNELRYYKDNLQKFSEQDWLSLTIAVTMDCNFDCSYCYEQGYRRTTKMDFKTADQVVKFAKRMIRPNSGMSVTWYGGEPLLALDVIEYLSDAFSKAGFTLHDNTIITNGYLLNEEVAKMLASKAGVTTVQITLDGTKEDHDKRRTLVGGQGTYDVILKNIRDTAKYFRSVNIRINADKNIAKSIPALVKEIRSTCPPNVVPYLSFVRSEDREIVKSCLSDKEYADLFLSNIDITDPLPRPYFGCTATMENGWGIDPEGNLYKCWEETGNTKLAVGNIWEGVTDYKKYSKWLSYNVEAFPDKCKECNAMPTCGAGYCPLRVLFPEESSVGILCQPQKWYLDEMLKNWIDRNVTSNQRQNTVFVTANKGKVPCSNFANMNALQRISLFYSWLFKQAVNNFKDNLPTKSS